MMGVPVTRASFDGDLWVKLQPNPSADTTWRASKVSSLKAADRDALIAVDQFNRRHLLVPAQLARYDTHPSGTLSVVVHEARFDFGNSIESGRFIDICCTEPVLNDQFNQVISDVLNFIENSPDPARSATERLWRWRHLFETAAVAPGLDTSQKIGIFAELTLLNHLIVESPNFDLQCWTGPSREPRDFELSHCSVEVKGITSNSRSITIHGVDQLEPGPRKRMLLAIVTVDREQSGLSIADLADHIARKITNRSEFENVCAKLGISNLLNDQEKFRASSIRIASLDNDSPRITTDHLTTPTRLSLRSLLYEIDLARLDEFCEFVPIERFGGFFDE